jgi:hypothetical protein
VPAAKSSRRRLPRAWRPAAAVTAAALLLAALTTAVFLDRAGAGTTQNWPVNYLLAQSDNTVLFQLMQDVFHGHTLSWQFSPQIYVFPEMPISFVAYVLGGGSIYVYMLFVGVINNLLLFGAVTAVAKVLRPTWSLRDRLALALLASTPLVLMPLIGHDNVFFYNTAAVYYVGTYIFTILAPLMVWAPRKWVRMAVAVGFALTVASDPLLLAVSLPAMAIALLAVYLRDGAHALRQPILRLGVPVVVGYLVRLVLLSGLVAASPSSYISVSRFKVHVSWLDLWYRTAFPGHIGVLLKVLMFAGVAVSVLGTIVALRRFFVRRIDAKPHRAGEPDDAAQSDAAALTSVAVLIAPVTGVVAMFLLLVLYQYYLWPLVVGTVVVALLLAGRRLARYGAVAAVLLMVVLLLLPTSLHRYQHSNRYFKYVPALSQCMDRELPAGVNNGFATLSDARTYGLFGSRQLIMAQVLGDKSLGPNAWQANKGYFEEFRGSFFLANPGTAEPPITPSAVRARFGAPQLVRTCAGEVQLLIYTSQSSIDRIHRYYQKF